MAKQAKPAVTVHRPRYLRMFMRVLSATTVGVIGFLIMLFAIQVAQRIQSMPDPRPHEHVVVLDEGGVISDYIHEFATARQNGETYKIDGFCMSACTMILGLIPVERVCVTERAVFAFHAAATRKFDPETVELVREYNMTGTRMLWAIYPPKVIGILQHRGWMSSDVDQDEMIMVKADDLHMYRPCFEGGEDKALVQSD